MSLYPKRPLDEKLAWMRERQKRKAEAEENGRRRDGTPPQPSGAPAVARPTLASRKMMRPPDWGGCG